MKALNVAIPLVAGILGFGLARAGETAQSSSEAVKPAVVETRIAASPSVDPASPVAPASVPAAQRLASAKEISIEAKMDADIDVLRVIVPLLSDKQLAQVVESAAQMDGEAWKVVFEALLTSTSPEFLEFAEEALAEGKDADVADRIGDAFSLETHPGRKAVLGILLGKQRKGGRAVAEIEGVLQGMNGESVEHVMQHLELATFDDVTQARVASKLRALAIHAQDDENRLKAIRILREDASPAGVRFMMDRIVQDPNPECRTAAFKALVRRNPDDSLRRDLVQALMAVAANRAAEPEQRREAAGRLQVLAVDKHRGLLSEEHHALLAELSPPAREED